MDKRLWPHIEALEKWNDSDAAKAILREHALSRHWAPETLRSRYDGAKSLLDWRAAQPFPPRLEYMDSAMVERYLDWLSGRLLSKATIRGYRRGAQALLRAIQSARGHKHPRDPFQEARPRRQPPRLPEVELDLVPSERTRARLRALLALLKAGFTIPEACELEWGKVDLARGEYVARWGGKVRFTPAALQAVKLLPRQGRGVIGWSPATARKHLKDHKAPDEELALVLGRPHG
jgi:hypothetical protein